ncbi:MAG: hypothetical protein LBP22_06425 [Deltaproteobacteria bacterium]|nr:hypothetical protein [Deltaproteobacteria bacterium]
MDDFSGIPATENFVRTPEEIGTTPPKVLLYHAVYLTLREDSDGSYILDDPNFEVRTALSALSSVYG